MKLLLALLMALCVGFAGAADLNLFQAGTLSLDVPAGWKFTGGHQRAEGYGPDGEGVIVNYRTLLPGSSTRTRDQFFSKMTAMAATLMPELASQHKNEVRRPFNERITGYGRTQFSTVSQGKKLFRDYYFLQYMLLSHRTMVYMRVEGYGKAEDAAQRFELILATQRWDE